MAPEGCERAPVTACPLLYGGADAFEVVRRQACGLVYVEDRPSDAALRGFYPSDSYYDGYKPPVPYALFESRGGAALSGDLSRACSSDVTAPLGRLRVS